MFVGAFQHGIEAAREHVLLNLAVPLIGHELVEPFGNTSQLRSREPGNNRLKFFNAHYQILRLIYWLEK